MLVVSVLKNVKVGLQPTKRESGLFAMLHRYWTDNQEGMMVEKESFSSKPENNSSLNDGGWFNSDMEGQEKEESSDDLIYDTFPRRGLK